MGFPVVVILLGAAIIAAFFLSGQYAPEANPPIYDALSIVANRYNPDNPAHYRSLTDAAIPLFGHVFVHYGWPHLLMNMIAFIQAGPFVAARMGAVRFLALFFLSGLGGAIAFILLLWNQNAAGVGASGAICGVFAAYFLSVRPTPQAALSDPRVRNAMLMFVGINVVLFAVLPIGVSWQAHLGGFVAGGLAYVLLSPRAARTGPWG